MSGFLNRSRGMEMEKMRFEVGVGKAKFWFEMPRITSIMDLPFLLLKMVLGVPVVVGLMMMGIVIFFVGMMVQVFDVLCGSKGFGKKYSKLPQR